jgi:uncharacterized protein (TIGR03643 family)
MLWVEYKHINRIIEMTWGNFTYFEAIRLQLNILEKEVIALMRKQLKASNFQLWRKRQNSEITQKHGHPCNPEINHFKCAHQKSISKNKISKR